MKKEYIGGLLRTWVGEFFISDIVTVFVLFILFAILSILFILSLLFFILTIFEGSYLACIFLLFFFLFEVIFFVIANRLKIKGGDKVGC